MGKIIAVMRQLKVAHCSRRWVLKYLKVTVLVCVELNGERAVFHRPHPENTTDKGAVKSIRRFLENAGVSKDEL